MGDPSQEGSGPGTHEGELEVKMVASGEKKAQELKGRSSVVERRIAGKRKRRSHDH